MKIVIAPQAFKGSISALRVAEMMAEGVRRVSPDARTELVPVADGGDGTLETLVEASGGEIRSSEVMGPLGETRTAVWGAMGDGRTAVIEMARTSGLALVAVEDRNPLVATTYGLGQAISDALDSGFRRFILGIGGSATNDAGAGMAQALGARLLDAAGDDLPPGGAALADLDRVDLSGLDTRIADSDVAVACDVTNPLTGPVGASAVYGPQKGATPEMVEQLDAALAHMASVVRRDLGVEIDEVPGAGAAGGLGGGMIGFLGGHLEAGVDIVLETVGLEGRLDDADLVITGEGSVDYQTVYNKAPIGVARLAKARGIPVVAIVGSLGERYREVHDHGIDAVLAITSAPMTLEEASGRAEELVADAAEQAMRMMAAGTAAFGSERSGLPG
jgi:glycerate kinase